MVVPPYSSPASGGRGFVRFRELGGRSGFEYHGFELVDPVADGSAMALQVLQKGTGTPARRFLHNVAEAALRHGFLQGFRLIKKLVSPGTKEIIDHHRRLGIPAAGKLKGFNGPVEIAFRLGIMSRDQR